MILRTMQEVRRTREESSNYLSLYTTYKTYKNETKLTRLEYGLILKVFFYTFVHELILSSKAFVLPSRLGVIGIRKVPTHGRGFFDYKLYRETGIKRYKQNNHSEQLVARVYWHQAYNRMRDKLVCIFKLSPVRELTRNLSKHIKNNNAISQYYDK